MKKKNKDRNQNNFFNRFKKIPKIRLNKLKMDYLGHLDELDVDFSRRTPHKAEEPKADFHYEPTSYISVPELVNRAKEKFSDNIFILDKDKPRDKEYKKYTYKKFFEDVESFGTSLIADYMQKGEPIAIIGENQYEWYVSYITALSGAGIAVPIDKELPEHEIENVINRSKATVIIYSSSVKSKIQPLINDDKVNTVKYFIMMKSDEAPEGRTVGFDRILLEGKIRLSVHDDRFTKITVDPDEYAALFFTSGTTSTSKGVAVSSRQLVSNINAVTAYVKTYPEDRFFSVLPLHHTYESSIGFLLAFQEGASIAVCQGLKYISNNLKEAKPTILIAVPLLIEHLYDAIMKNIKKSKKEKIVASLMQTTNALKSLGVDVKRKVFKDIYDGIGGNLRVIVTAAAPIDDSIGKWFANLGLLFLQGYGLTETCPICAVTPDFDTRIGSAGKINYNAFVRVDDPDSEGKGEIVVSTDTLMIGYYEDDEATEEVIEVDENGRRWFHTGDLGRVDSDGYIYITGRKKSVIVTQNGKNIYPEELELIINNLDIVSESMVYGRENQDSKELTITVRILPDYDFIKNRYGDISTKEIYNILKKEINSVNKKLVKYKNIKKIEIKDEPFIKTSTMKIKRYAEVADGIILDID